MKCGIIVSKYHPGKPATPSSSISFVASAPPADSLRIPLVTRRDTSFKSGLVTLVIVMALAAAGFYAYRFFRGRAAHYSGEYKNLELIFALKFPVTDSHWFHYYPGELQSPLYQGAQDAFFRKGSNSKPDLILGVWTEKIVPWPERLNEEAAARKLEETQNELLALMEQREVDCAITAANKIMPGGNAGFRIEADLHMDGEPMKLVAVRATNLSTGYWIFISGKDDDMSRYADEVDAIAGSLHFRMSII